jgi:lysophospholipid acyltransferase (LPLAT)-like uncharacterized protein
MEPAFRLGWLARLLGTLLAGYVALVARTTRASGPPINQGQVIFAIWHESNLAAAVAVLKLRRDAALVSFSTRGFRGVVMNTMLGRLGGSFVSLPAEGRQTRAEAARLSREMARIGREGRSLVVSCDGPFGPHRAAKPGVLIVARESGLPIQPWAVALRPAWRLKGRWDRQLVPLPFGGLRVDEGAEIRIGPREPIKPRLAELQTALQRVADLADRRMAGGAAGEV